ncbi:FAD-dependent monooxygenase [Amaricoccus sp.]|uniref:FAD-dependent monooxygenase n=1 Tax=Amaricoccus sp. TaxID=1872485 RepID=UPI001B3F6746|nr:FAD-dependent monooxygenase [Amaricoccus sp.]MBP7003229.1 FAD-dependent monooxygenase [Amaricoccus sp.]
MAEIAVIGGGVGGLAAAVALARRGLEVAVHEQAAALAEVGAGLQLAPNAVAVLEALGLRDAVEAVAATPEAVELRDGLSGRSVARLPLGAACVARYGRPYWHVHRADLLAALAAGAAEAGVTLRLGSRVTEVTDAGDRVRVRLAGGAEEKAAVAAAADGVRSGLRAAHFGGAAPRFTGNVAWRALVPAARLAAPPLPRAATVFMGPRRHLVAYPLRKGALWNLVAVEERAAWTEEGWSAPGDAQALRRAFAGWAEPVPTLLAAVSDCFLWGLFDHPRLPAWARGRLALLGDACHPMTPFLAQGATMALEDAWVLADALAARRDDPAAGLAAYEDRRIARASRVQAAAGRSGRAFHLANPALRAAAHAGLAAVARLAPDRLAGRLDWLWGANVVGPGATD